MKIPSYLFDGFVKSPTSALRGIPRNLRALNLKLFTLPSNTVYLRVHQTSTVMVSQSIDILDIQ
jgi:hypothetical protein